MNDGNGRHGVATGNGTERTQQQRKTVQNLLWISLLLNGRTCAPAPYGRRRMHEWVVGVSMCINNNT